MTDINKQIEEEVEYDWDDDEYIEESRCVRCEQEISNEEDINNLGMCNVCYRNSRLCGNE